MKDRLLLLYELHKIDKDLEDINELKGDLPHDIEEMKKTKDELQEKLEEVQEQLKTIEEEESKIKEENDVSFKRINKNDEVLRVGGVTNNEEYNALAKEIDDAYEVIEKNDEILDKTITPRKTDAANSIRNLEMDLDELKQRINIKQEELDELTEQNEEEEKELNTRRREVLKNISQEDLEMYERINKVMFGEAIALVRKGSCLGCYNAIPPQREIEIKMAERFFHCETCGRLLIHEDLVK